MESPHARGWRPSLLAAAAAASVGVVAALGTDAAERETRSSPAPALTVAVRPARALSGYRVQRSYVGRLEAARRSEVGFDRAGRVEEIRVDEGDRVVRGEVLARLDGDRLEARLAQREARAEEARASRDLALATRKRMERALEKDAVSAQRRDEAVRTHEMRAAAHRRAVAEARQVRVDLEESVLRAPFDAVVASRRSDEGGVLRPGEPLLTLLERSKLEARVGLPAEAAASLSQGDSTSIVVNGRRHTAVLRAVLPENDSTTGTLTARLDVDADWRRVSAGAVASLEVERRVEAKGFWLPVAALTEDARGLWSCFVAEPVTGGGSDRATHVLRRRDLVLIHEARDSVFVRGALRDGELVVARGVHRIVEGLRVRAGGAEEG